MAGHGSKSWDVKQQVAEALAAGENVKEAAAGARITTRTVYRWLSDDLDFKLLLQRIRAEMLHETHGLRVAAAKRAAVRLLRLIADEDPKVASKAVFFALADADMLAEEVAHRASDVRSLMYDADAEAEAEAQREANEELAMQLLGRNGTPAPAPDEERA